MKASLLLSLGLLLALLASPSTTVSESAVSENQLDDNDSTEFIPINSGGDTSTDSSGAPESGSTPDVPETPESGSTPDVPETPESGSTPDVPETPESGSTPEPTEAPESGSTPDVPETPESGSTPEPTEAPESGSTPDVPETPESGSTPEPTEAPESGSTPDVPETPESGSTPEPTEAPESGSTPDVPETPESGSTPEPTEAPESGSTPDVPETPESGSTPEPTETPESGSTPEPTETPESGSTPEPTETPESGSTPEPTEAPESGSTPEPTEAPESGSTPEPTEAPESGSTPEPTEEPESGSTPEPSGTTESPGVSSQTTSTGPPNYCKLNPCGESASCVNLHTKGFCVCSEGYYYKKPSCEKGKTFPGEIKMKVSESLDWEDKNSELYQDFHNQVVKFFEKAFNEAKVGSDYGQTIIIKVSASTSQSARSVMRAAGETTVYVSVANVFNENTSLNESTITEAINEAVRKDSNMDLYVRQDLCDYYGCDNNDEGCQNPLQCTCKSGLTRSNPQNPFCLPLECSRSCSAVNKKQCLKNGNGPLECACMSGYQKSTGDKCEACPFGYSGQDCKDPFQLILTIVGTVAGALILILLIAFIISASSKNKKKNVEEQKLIDEDFQNVRLQQTGFSNSGFSNSGFSNSGFSNNSDYSNFGAGNSIFPKVKTGLPSQTQNPYANQRSMPRPDY